MQTADAGTTEMAMNPRAGDAGLVVRFEMMDFLDQAASKEAGYPIYRRGEGVTIHAPGKANIEQQIIDLGKEKVRARYASKFPVQYAHFKAGAAAALVGTSLDMWPPALGQTGLLKHHGVQTVEQLASVNDSALQILGSGSIGLRQKARDWLEAAKGLAPIAAQAAKNEDLENKLAVAMAAIETLQKNQGIAPTPVVELAKPKRIRNRAKKEAVP